MQTLDKNKIHALVVTDCRLANKVVQKGASSFNKWNVSFSTGYKGELLTPIQPGSHVVAPVRPGQIVYIRIGYRNEYGDEIELVSKEAYEAVQQKPQMDLNMSGHPRTIALAMAVQVCNKRADLMGGEENEAENVIQFSRLFEQYLSE